MIASEGFKIPGHGVVAFPSFTLPDINLCDAHHLNADMEVFKSKSFRDWMIGRKGDRSESELSIIELSNHNCKLIQSNFHGPGP